MDYEITCDSTFPVLKVFLQPGEKFFAEPSSYVLHKGKVSVVSKKSGSLFNAIKKSFAGGESFFINEFTANSQSEIWFTPGWPGEITAFTLCDDVFIVQDSCYLGHTGDIKVGTKLELIKGIFTRSGLLWLKIEGNGMVFLNSYGKMEEIKLSLDEILQLDPGHFVAISYPIRYEAKPFGGVRSFLFGGEGFVFEVKGPGRVIVQTKNQKQLEEMIAKVIKELSKK